MAETLIVREIKYIYFDRVAKDGGNLSLPYIVKEIKFPKMEENKSANGHADGKEEISGLFDIIL